MDELNEKANGNQHLVPYSRPHYVPATLDEAVRIARALFISGAFNDIGNAQQAFAKILAGMEIGIGPMASLMGIHFVQGKPTYSATLIGSLIQQSGVYSYAFKEPLTDTRCVLAFYRHGRFMGDSVFTWEDAKRAQLVSKKGDNYEKYPRNMLFARALSNGAKWYCPEVFAGGTIYTPEEIRSDRSIIETDNLGLDAFIDQTPQVGSSEALQSLGDEGGDIPDFDEAKPAQTPAAPATEQAKAPENPSKRLRPEPPARFINVKALFAWLRDVAKISEKEALTVLGKKNQLDVVDPMASCLEVLEFFWPANPPEGKAPYDLTDPRD